GGPSERLRGRVRRPGVGGRPAAGARARKVTGAPRGAPERSSEGGAQAPGQKPITVWAPRIASCHQPGSTPSRTVPASAAAIATSVAVERNAGASYSGRLKYIAATTLK